MKPLLYTVLSLSSAAFGLSACQPITTPSVDTGTPWHLMLSHDSQGSVLDGSSAALANAVRNGCQIRIAWGNARTQPPRRSIEHVADVKWISFRNDEEIHAQIGDFLINLTVLGEPEDEHPRRAEFGGTQQVVKWRAILQTDGTFDAVWFAPHSGEFITRRPQRHPMKWFSDCPSQSAEPLYAPG